MAGRHGEIEPGFEYGGAAGNVNFSVSGSDLCSDLGVESLDGSSTPLHDHTDQFQGFAYVEDIIDPSTRVSVILGAANQRFQTPDIYGLSPSLLFGAHADQPLLVQGQTQASSAALNDR